MTDRLDVWCFGRRAGELRDEPNGLAFDYDADWIDSKHPPLSQSLPQSGAFSNQAVQAFFGGLLPEGEVRGLLARRLGVSEGNEFALLERVGGDCAGAVTLLPPGEVPSDHPGSANWLDDGDLETLVRELPQRPMHVDDGGELWWDPFLDQALDAVAERARWLSELSAPRGRGAVSAS